MSTCMPSARLTVSYWGAAKSWELFGLFGGPSLSIPVANVSILRGQIYLGRNSSPIDEEK